jgi:hypothetical protein
MVNSDDNIYDVYETTASIESNKYVYSGKIVRNVTIPPGNEIELYYIDDLHNMNDIDTDQYRDVSFKDMLEHSDAVSLSWSIPGASNYLQYLLGRFGERGFLTQSAGNDGDHFESTTEHSRGVRLTGPYGDYENLPLKKYHTNAFLVSALT